MIKRTADLVNDKKLKELQIFAMMNQRLHGILNCSLHLVSIILHW
jgi:hypothetical protein